MAEGRQEAVMGRANGGKGMAGRRIYRQRLAGKGWLAEEYTGSD
ncbi:hypothetical protein SIO70_20580 [Chitinophaga sancti]|nr:hypothetical protein [Chitinophaga sancti]WPQ60753.1 hypothetical protein SIO70_20580 [Chitinophaga sancti]